MKKSRFAETQIVAILGEADTGVTVKDRCNFSLADSRCAPRPGSQSFFSGIRHTFRLTTWPGARALGLFVYLQVWQRIVPFWRAGQILWFAGESLGVGGNSQGLRPDPSWW